MAQQSAHDGDDGLVKVASPTDRVDNGWDDAARAVFSVRKIDAPMGIVLQPDARAPYLLDLQGKKFYSTDDLTDFPTHPVHVGVQTYVVSADDVLPPGPGRNLELLLWNVGRSSFHGGLAPWLSPTAPYRLTAWPDFTGVFHTTFHLRLTAHLANHVSTVNELVDLFPADADAVPGAMNAFSLLGILESMPAQPAAEPVADQREASEPVRATGGLWSRLRDRWGF
jgi:hypothetical protein